MLWSERITNSVDHNRAYTYMTVALSVPSEIEFVDLFAEKRWGLVQKWAMGALREMLGTSEITANNRLTH